MKEGGAAATSRPFSCACVDPEWLSAQLAKGAASRAANGYGWLRLAQQDHPPPRTLDLPAEARSEPAQRSLRVEAHVSRIAVVMPAGEVGHRRAQFSHQAEPATRHEQRIDAGEVAPRIVHVLEHFGAGDEVVAGIEPRG